MITEKQITDKQRQHGYDWHSAYLSCLLERSARTFADALGLGGMPRPAPPHEKDKR